MKIFAIETGKDNKVSYFGNYRTKEEAIQEWAQGDEFLKNMIRKKDIIFLNQEEMCLLLVNIGLALEDSITK